MGNTVTGYGGLQPMVFTNPANSPNGTAPIYPGTVNFTNGVGTATITLFDAQSTTLKATASMITGTSANFTVNPAAMSGFTLSTPSPTAGTQFNENVDSTDPYGNVVTTYTGTQCLTFTGPASSPNSTAPAYPGRGSFPTGAMPACRSSRSTMVRPPRRSRSSTPRRRR